MASRGVFAQQYASSHALIIGVNAYTRATPLRYARQDAEAVSGLLVRSFAFAPGNVSVLLDQDATGAAIRDSFSRFTREDAVGPDDRLVVFFAGHGATKKGHRGEIGFLVPVDGDPDDVASLVRWDEFTKGSELIAHSGDHEHPFRAS